MFEITEKKDLTDNIIWMKVKAEMVSRSCLPGQFVIVRTNEMSERIPLTICDYDRNDGTIVIVFQTIGTGTSDMAALNAGDSFQDVVGPLGMPSDLCSEDPEKLEKLKQQKIIFIAGGVGTAPVYPQLKWLKEHGVKADAIVGTKTKSTLILEPEMKSVTDHLYIATDDGSYGKPGMVTGVLQELSDSGNHYDRCIAIGPMIMMKFVCSLTRTLKIPTTVSLNPIMVDGTGMCGACRVLVGGKVKFACVDGPEFDGHLVDFDTAMKRQQQYKTLEGRAILARQEGDTHRGGCRQC